MAKKKKTREQKIMADKRREVLSTALYSFSAESLKQQAKQPTSTPRQTVAVAANSYHYLASDLRKTALFTLVVVVFELGLRYFMK